MCIFLEDCDHALFHCSQILGCDIPSQLGPPTVLRTSACYSMAANKPAAARPRPVPTYCLVARPEALAVAAAEEPDALAEDVRVALEEVEFEPPLLAAQASVALEGTVTPWVAQS